MRIFRGLFLGKFIGGEKLILFFSLTKLGLTGEMDAVGWTFASGNRCS
ncbi:hypothetical protein [Bartonella sp. CB178]